MCEECRLLMYYGPCIYKEYNDDIRNICESIVLAMEVLHSAWRYICVHKDGFFCAPEMPINQIQYLKQVIFSIYKCIVSTFLFSYYLWCNLLMERQRIISIS